MLSIGSWNLAASSAEIEVCVCIHQAGNDRDVAQVDVGLADPVRLHGGNALTINRDGAALKRWMADWKNAARGECRHARIVWLIF